jgi:hypothetical protein
MKRILTLTVLVIACLLCLPPQSSAAAAKSSPSPAAATASKATPTPAATATPEVQEDSNDDSDRSRDTVSFGHSVTIEEGETVKEAVVFGGNLKILGTVERDAVCFGGKLTLGPHAVVGGDVVNVGGHAEIDPDAKVKGDTIRVGGGVPFGVNWPHVSHGPEHAIYRFAHHARGVVWRTAWFCFYAFCALLLTVFLPQHLARIEEYLTAAFPRSALLGLGAMIGLPIVCLVLVATCIGILLVPVVVLVAFVSAIMGYVAFAHILGQRLAAGSGPFVQILFGLLLLQAAGIVAAILDLPGGAFSIASGAFGLLDRVIFWVVSFLGLGAVLFSRWGRDSVPQPQA